jgi:hypothetical protein
MLAAFLDTVSSLFLFTVVVLLFAIAVAYFAPAIRVTQQSFFTVLAYLAGEVAVLLVALWVVSGIAGLGVLPMLLAIGIAALIFVPGLAAKIPVPANLGGLFKRS